MCSCADILPVEIEKFKKRFVFDSTSVLTLSEAFKVLLSHNKVTQEIADTTMEYIRTTRFDTPEHLVLTPADDKADKMVGHQICLNLLELQTPVCLSPTFTESLYFSGASRHPLCCNKFSSASNFCHSATIRCSYHLEICQLSMVLWQCYQCNGQNQQQIFTNVVFFFNCRKMAQQMTLRYKVPSASVKSSIHRDFLDQRDLFSCRHTAIRPQVMICDSQLSDSVRYLTTGADERRLVKIHGVRICCTRLSELVMLPRNVAVNC